MKRVALAAVPIVLVAVLALVFTRGERGSAVARNEPAPAPEEREEAVLVDPGEVAPSGLAERPEKRREVETPAPAETPPAPVAEPPPTATAIGRLVDEATGEPVPFQEIDFNLSRDDTERLVTDEHGNFESSHTHPTGTVRIDLRRLRTGGWMQPIRVEHDVDDRRRVDVPVRIGPTYRLDLEVPAGVELTDLMVSLDAAHPVEDVLGSRAREAEVRAGDLPWVRFQKPLLYEEPAPPWELAVAAKGTAWRGTAPVDSITGIYPELVRIVLMKSAELGGRLASARAESVRAFIELSGVAGVKTYGPFEHESYQIRWLDPGDYRLAVHSLTHEHPEVELQVAVGESKELDLVVTARPLGGAVAGVVRSETGKRYEHLSVFLRAAEHVKLVDTQKVQWQSDADHGTFRFDGLAVGEYRFSLYAPSLPLIEPSGIDAAPPREDLEFVIRDADASLRRYTLRAVDAETGDCIPGPELSLRSGRGKRGTRKWASGCKLEFGPYRPDDTLEWVLRCEGYEAAWGDGSSFVQKGRSFAARLRRGWSGRVAVHDTDGTPLAGVAVVLDDGSSEATDVDGRAVLYRRLRPKTIALVFGDWRITAGDVDPKGSFADTGFEIDATLAPPE